MRSGLKFALAGMLALYFALLLRLDEPTWAVTTAFVLSTPKFVGAIGEKTVLRVLGAIIGAIIGYLITGSAEQTPWLFLAAMGGLVAFTTAMYGGTLVPYGFRQCGYTATLVAAQGMSDPRFSWHVGLARCEEICLGIIVTMVVTTTVWPRYARKEFVSEVRGTLGALARLFEQRAKEFVDGSGTPAPDVLGMIGGRLAKMRKMIRLGCMESVAFRSRRAAVDEVVSQLGQLSTALSNFGRTLPAESIFRAYLGDEISGLHEAMAAAIGGLADASVGRADRRALMDRCEAQIRAYEVRLQEFRREGIGENLTDDESFEHAGYALSIREIHAAVVRLDDLLPVVEAEQPASIPFIRLEAFTMPDAGWIRSGIRGGLAVAIGLFLVNWLQPPGGDLLVVGTYLFTAFSLESPDRRGDLGVFSLLVATALIAGTYLVFLLLAAPMMSSYAVFNTVFGAALFLIGYFSEKGTLGSFTTLLALLMVVILVGLNAQRPVAFEDIAGPILGLMLAVILSAVVRRILWPALPQNALRERLSGILALLESAASHPDAPVPAPDRAKIALAAADALELVDVLKNSSVHPPDESARLRAHTRSLARLGGHLIASSGPPILPPEAEALYDRERRALLAWVGARLRDQRAAVDSSASAVGLHDDSAPSPREWTSECRRLIRAAKTDIPKTLADLGLLYRCEQTALVAVESSRIAASLDLSNDFSDDRL